MTAADKRGQGDEILLAAAAHFGLSVDEGIGSDRSDAEIDDLPDPLSGVPAQRQADSLEMPKDGEALATPRSSPEGELCLLAFEAWDATGEWPKARVLQRRIERHRGRLDIEVTGRALSPNVGYLEKSESLSAELPKAQPPRRFVHSRDRFAVRLRRPPGGQARSGRSASAHAGTRPQLGMDPHGLHPRICR